MRIKTDFVPADCDYLTVGKAYDSVNSTIIADNGSIICVEITGCSHLDWKPWQVVEDEPFDITKHEFNSSFIESAEVGKFMVDLHIRPVNCLSITKRDIIALAKAMGVTGGDL